MAASVKLCFFKLREGLHIHSIHFRFGWSIVSLISVPPSRSVGGCFSLSLSRVCCCFGFPLFPQISCGAVSRKQNPQKKPGTQLGPLEPGSSPHKQPNSTNSRSKISSSLSTLQMKRKFPWVEREQQSVLPTDSVPLA